MEKRILATIPVGTNLTIDSYREKFDGRDLEVADLVSIYQSLLTDLSEVIRSIQHRGVCLTQIDQSTPADEVLHGLMCYFTADMLHKHIDRFETVLAFAKMSEDFKTLIEGIETQKK